MASVEVRVRLTEQIKKGVGLRPEANAESLHERAASVWKICPNASRKKPSRNPHPPTEIGTACTRLDIGMITRQAASAMLRPSPLAST